MRVINYNGTDIEYDRNTVISIFKNNVVIKAGNKEYEFSHKTSKERTEHVRKFRREYERILDGF